MANEKRLIDADLYKGKLIRELNKTGKYTAYESGLDDAIFYLDEQPTVDAVPVVHGRWLYDSGSGKSFCSHCSSYALTFKKNETEMEYITDHCPSCGTKLDGDGNEL